MGYNEQFWVVAGTAAPVVALAAVVAISDAYRAFDRAAELARNVARANDQVRQELFSRGLPLRDRMATRGEDLKARANGAVLWLYWTCCAEAALLAVSLVSIANKRNLVWPPLAIGAAVAGIVVLVFVGMVVAGIRSAAARWLQLLEDVRRGGVMEDADGFGLIRGRHEDGTGDDSNPALGAIGYE